jgi:transcriptional regulator with XRE-family HTH domain
VTQIIAEKIMDLDNVLSELLKIVRGSKSQNQLSQALGFSDNRYNRWENLKKPLYWSDFVRLCQLQKLDLKSILNEVFNYEGELTTSEIVNFFSSSWSGKELNHVISSVHEKTINRWITGESEPKLVALFELIEVTQHILYEFLYEMMLHCDERSHLIEQKYNEHINLKKVFYGRPESIYIIICTELDHYKKNHHSDHFHFFSETLNFDYELVKEVCEAMMNLGILIKDDEHFVFNPLSKATASRKSIDDKLTRKSLETRLDLTKQYLYFRKKEKDLFFDKTFVSNEKLDHQINEVVKKCMRDISKLIKDSTTKGETFDRLRVLNLQSYDHLRD